MLNRLGFGCAAVAALMLLLVMRVTAAGDTVVVYGADTTSSQRAELATIFGVAPSAPATTVSTPEMETALQGTGLTVAPTDKSISSSALTCLSKGGGLSVQTQNITRISAPIYAGALVTAGVGDASVIIAAPPSDPVTGETALVGVLKAFSQCPGGIQPDPVRVGDAYKQIAWAVRLAGPSGDLNKAGAMLLQAEQPVITGQAKDATAVGSALDGAAGAQGIAVDPSLRPSLIAFLQGIGTLNYGGYAKSFQIQQESPTEVKVVPTGAGAPVNAQATSVPVARPASTGGAVFKGQVAQSGQTLTVKTSGQNRQVGTTPNVIVTRNGKKASLANIQKNDTVTVTTNASGAATRIDATSSGGGAGFLAWLIPLLIAVGLAALLLWWLAQRRRSDSFILAPNDSTVLEGRSDAAPTRDTGRPTSARPRG
jgi:hypothetical protein